MADSISPRETRALLDSETPVALIDVRTPKAYTEGHIEESTLVPRRELEFRLGELVSNRRTPIVLCDRRGERTHLDARWLETLGYKDVAHLEGGVEAWTEAGFDLISAEEGVYSTAFNYPSKKFGEEVETDSELPALDPDELKRKMEREEVLVVDVRTPEEHSQMTIPGSINVEGVDLGLYVEELRDDDQPVVVHCAGRTRSIIGTATLERLGVSNVYELENGTMGWELAGYGLEEGSDRRMADLDVDDDRYDRLRRSAERLLEENGVPLVDPETLCDHGKDPKSDSGSDSNSDDRRPRYVIDVRTEAEFEAGTLPGARSIPGGQLIQTADRHLAVREADVILVSDTHVRAAVTAYWLSEMGFPNVSVLRDGMQAWRDGGGEIVEGGGSPRPVGEGTVERIVERVSPEAIESGDLGESIEVVNVDRGRTFESGHLPGSRWLSRNDLEAELESGLIDPETVLVLTCESGRVSSYAAAKVRRELGRDAVYALEGGISAWKREGRPVAKEADDSSTDSDEEVVPVYEQGRDAMRTYLRWESNLTDG